MGQDWRAFRDQVQLIATKVLDDRLDQIHAFAGIDDDNYILLFAERTNEAARTEAARLCALIDERLREETPRGKDIAARYMVVELGTTIEDDDVATLADLTEWLDAAIRSKALEEAGTEAHDGGPSGAPAPRAVAAGRAVLYRATLHVDKELFTIFSCRPGPDLRPGPTRRTDDRDGGTRDDAQFLEVDVALVQAAIKDLGELIERGGRCLIMAPVHFQSVVRRGKEQLIDAFREVPDYLRAHLVIDILDTPLNASASRLHEIVSTVSPFTRAVALRLPLEDPQLERFVPTFGLSALGAEAGRFTTKSAEAPSAMAAAMARFVRQAKDRNLRSYFFGADSQATLDAAVAAGFDYIAGEALEPETASPATLFPCEPAKIHRPAEPPPATWPLNGALHLPRP